MAISQYQDQRVSLALKFQIFSDSHWILFTVVSLLIDNTIEKAIQSVERFIYLFVNDCMRKLNDYLLYATRSKEFERENAIYIDIYEKGNAKI